MFGIPSPYMLLGAAVAAIGIYFVGHHNGWAARDREMQAQIAKMNALARDKEQQAQEALNDQAKLLVKAKNEVSKKQSTMDRLADTGGLRLPTSSCVSAPANPGAPSGDSRPDGAELERATIKALNAIAADGDRAIVQLRACVAAYEEVREAINDKR